MIYLTEEQKTRIEELNLSNLKRWKEFQNTHKFTSRWHLFWNSVYKGKKTDTILDFGAGPCWCEFVGRKNGFQNITSLDIDDKEVKESFSLYTNILKMKPQYWNGKKIDISDNTFDSIVAKSSILKMVKTEFKIEMQELTRVSKQNCLWYIAPILHYHRLNTELKNNNLWPLLKQKNIILVGWLQEG